MARRAAYCWSVTLLPSVALCTMPRTPAALAARRPSRVTVLWWLRSTRSTRSGRTTGGGGGGVVPPRSLSTLAVAALALLGPQEQPYRVAEAIVAPRRTLSAGTLAAPFQPARTSHHAALIGPRVSSSVGMPWSWAALSRARAWDSSG